LALPLLLVLILYVTRGFWTAKISESLTCQEQIEPSDALLIENFDPDYLLFERAAALQNAGIAARIFVPVEAGRDPTNTVSKGIADVMAGVAHIPSIELIPFEKAEPISLNAAKQIRGFLTRQHVKSVVVVTSDYRSRRSLLVYHAVLSSAGIRVGCAPVFGPNPANWTGTWHGIQAVALQFVKLQYYRFYVLL